MSSRDGATDDTLSDFTVRDETYLGATRRVYRKGSGPAVIIIAEMPGISPAVADFARRIVDIGATAVMPSPYGVDGRDPSPAARGTLRSTAEMLGTIARACVSREFTILATGKTSPVVNWLRALAADEHRRCGGVGVGAIGMCFTGGFALGMATDERLLAPILAQPSLPAAISPGRARAIDVSPADLSTVAARCAAGLEVMGVRFEGDRMSPPARFENLRRLLGDAFTAIELPDSAANPDSPMPTPPHAALTVDLIDEPGQPTRDALDQVLGFLTRRLQLDPPGPHRHEN
ncbi:dienelactone hydrolase family protein [Gordonia sp. DT30]|uniref:dienelactone hydrolase family protein n=1 Tax=unclassified Gordonia (in: high G+C Gram-positive bacteria) TaxID=2657482 RepID=UPI003CEC6A4A